MSIKHSIAVPDKYQITKHAKERLTQRFLLREEWIRPWTLDLMSNAKFIKDQQEEGKPKRELWETGTIRFVIEPNRLKVISVWSMDANSVELTKQSEIDISDNPDGKLVPELVEVLDECINDYDIKTFKRHSGRLMNKEAELAELHAKVINTSTHDYIRNQRAQILELEKEINKENNSYEAITDSIKRASNLFH